MLKRYPGFIDVHVHLREPGAEQKEDYVTGTRAAAAGGFTLVLDMPNNPTPTISQARLAEKIKLVGKKAVCGVGFHFGTNGANIGEFRKVWARREVYGLKLYLNHTTGEMLIEDPKTLKKIFASWESEKPILVHAEGEQLELALELAGYYRRRLHVCHISLKAEVEMVRRAKTRKQKVTAGVTPHHLFLTEADEKKLGPFAMMKPPVNREADRQALWQALEEGTIDLVETDHAPHTLSEKQGEKPPFGVPGLETAVGLMFMAVKEKRIKEARVVDCLYHKPREVFKIPAQSKTYVELDKDKAFTAGAGGWQTKCGWSPFAGWELFGKAETVVVAGKSLVKNGKLVI